MAANTAPIFERVPVAKGTQFTSADTTTKKTIYTAGTNGGRVDAISVCSDDTATVTINFYINDGATDFYFGYYTAAIGAGHPSVTKADALPYLRPAGQAYITLPYGYTLKAACNATMTSGKTLDIVVEGGDF